MNTTREEWQRLRDLHDSEERANQTEQDIFWQGQQKLDDQLRELMIKLILEEELIPKTGWVLQASSRDTSLYIHHTSSSHAEEWKPLLEVWSNSWPHGSLRIEGDGIDTEVNLRIDDDEMSINFTPCSKLTEFLEQYDLTITAEGLEKRREELVESLDAVDKLLEVLDK